MTVCAWCEAEGQKTVLKEGPEDVISHGICPEHKEAFTKEAVECA